MGYRWYDSQGKVPAYEFGFGLSYTTFAYSNLAVKPDFTVDFDLTNTGERKGIEVAQLYLEFPPSAGEPSKRLAGWARVELAPGERRRVQIAAGSLFPARLGFEWREVDLSGRALSRARRRFVAEPAAGAGNRHRPLASGRRCGATACVSIIQSVGPLPHRRPLPRSSRRRAVRLLPPRHFRQQPAARACTGSQQRGEHGAQRAPVGRLSPAGGIQGVPHATQRLAHRVAIGARRQLGCADPARQFSESLSGADPAGLSISGCIRRSPSRPPICPA